MQVHKNISIDGAEGKPILLDIFYKDGPPKPVIIYAHGFNGFKDWGHFDLIARQFAEAGFVFVKFNFSHNGTTPEHPEEFSDLEAYGQNNYTKELNDLQQVVEWTMQVSHLHAAVIDSQRLCLIGHSLGGGIVLLKGAEEKRVKAIATWASIAECKTPWGNWTAEQLDDWKNKGVAFYMNSRTKQKMPLYYQLYEDYQQHEQRLNIIQAVGRLDIPLLLCHGTQDEAVPVSKAYDLQNAHADAKLFLIESDHVFGRKHPGEGEILPDAMQKVIDETILFFKEVINQ